MLLIEGMGGGVGRIGADGAGDGLALGKTEGVRIGLGAGAGAIGGEVGRGGVVGAGVDC